MWIKGPCSSIIVPTGHCAPSTACHVGAQFPVNSTPGGECASVLSAAERSDPACCQKPSLESAIAACWQACHPEEIKKLRQEETHPSAGVLGRPWMANRGATCKCGVVAEPTRATLCSSSPNMHPADHMSIALVYPPLDITTCGKQQRITVHRPYQSRSARCAWRIHEAQGTVCPGVAEKPSREDRSRRCLVDRTVFD